jgi:ADP-ribosylglycohydrolase
MSEKRILGSLMGMALGDALGADTEFLNVDGILRKFPPSGPLEPPYPALVTDDTQMALAVGDALIAAERPFSPENLGEQFRRTFIDWYNDPENNRAPGNTCLEACEQLIEGKIWTDASQISSKGCGANMRVMPAGLLDIEAKTRAKIAQFQAAYTHGHPTGLAAADLTAFVIADLAESGDVLKLPERVRAYAQSQREIYHADWLGNLWERAIVMTTPQQYIAHGWDECLAVLDKLDDALIKMDRYADPCLATGAGWVAEQAFATALLCFLMYPDDPVAVIRRAAVTSGDSDSIACIAGSFAGAYHGIDAWPAEWVERIEYRNRLLNMSAKLHQINSQLTPN